MRSLRTLTCASLVLSTLSLSGFAAQRAGADASTGYSVSSIDPVLKTPLADVTFGADGAGDVADETFGDPQRTSGAVQGYPANSANPVALGTAAAPGISVAGGWVAFASAVDGSGNPTQATVVSINGYGARTITLANGQSFGGVTGTGALLSDVQKPTGGDDLEMQPPTGPAVVLAHGLEVGDAAADGNEIVASIQQSDGTWSVDHIDISGSTPVVTTVEQGQQTLPEDFTTASTYGWDDNVAHTVSWQSRGSVGAPHVLTLPSSDQGQAQTDGEQVSWVDSGDGLVLAPIGNPGAPVTLPVRDTDDAAISPRGFLFVGADDAVDYGLQVLAADDTYSPLDAIGANIDGTSGLALTAGRVVRLGSSVTSTPLTTDSAPSATGDPVDQLDAPGRGYVRASGDYTAVSGQTITVLKGSQVVFTSPAGAQNPYVLDLHGSDLVYALNGGNEIHVRDLATGVDDVFPGTAGYVEAGGGMIAELVNFGGPRVVFYPEMPSQQPTASYVSLPASLCASPLLERNDGFFIEVACRDGSFVVVDTLTGKLYPATQNETLGAGILLDSDYGSTSCLAVQVLTTGETSPTCVGTANTQIPVAVDDTGGSVAWVDLDAVTHIVKVLPDVPAAGLPTYPAYVSTGAPWTVDEAVTAPVSWILTLSDGLTGKQLTTITGSSPNGLIHASWPGEASMGSVYWTLAAVLAGGREVGFSGFFSVQPGEVTPPLRNLPGVNVAQRPAPPNLKFSLGRVKTVHGVVQLKRGHFALVTTPAGTAGCVTVVLQRQVKKKWKTVSSSHCLAANKKTITKETLAAAGSYRLEVIWSLARTRPLKVISIHAT